MVCGPIPPPPMRLLAILALCLPFAVTLRAGAQDTERQYLSGHDSTDAVPWDFFCTAGRGSGYWTKIPVPSCWEQEGFGAYGYGLAARPGKRVPVPPQPPEEKGIYRRDFTVPASWRGRDVRVVFEGVMTDAAVTVNGVSAGPVHQGAFYRFSYDITDKLRFGAENSIEVVVSKESANRSVNAAERRGDYWNFGGIFRPVWLESTPARFIDHVAIDAEADGRFSARVRLGGDIPVGARIELRLRHDHGAWTAPALDFPVPAGSHELTVSTVEGHPDLWTAETPNLYDAEFILRVDGHDVHRVTQRFGFRTLEVKPGVGLFLNGHRITLKGVCRHSFWPETGRTLSLAVQRLDVDLMKEANMNAVRMSHYPPDPEFLDLCDEAGLYVLDELGGWHGRYDTQTGRKLIREMVRRDVNHPSILFWDNGNEGGGNPANDGEFAKYDPQHRPVLHPWADFDGMNTAHYRDYADTVKLAQGPDIFMPTEFLHGLFDGGAGAGLDDYWKIMGEKPLAAGGFIWAWLDEAVARTDENGRLDAQGDLAPDGIVGPHREKEGSYYTIRDIWSPVQIPLATLPANFTGTLPVRNRYDFLNLKTVTFAWRLMRFGPPGALTGLRTLLADGRVPGPDVAPRTDGTVTLPLPADWRDADVLYVTAFDSRERALWTWSWRWKSGLDSIGRAALATSPRFPKYASPIQRPVEPPPVVAVADDGPKAVVTDGRETVRFDRTTGEIDGITYDGRAISLTGGPRLVAYRRYERGFVPVPGMLSGRLTGWNEKHEGDAVVLTATYAGLMREIRWTIGPDGDIRLDYAFKGPGTVDLLGVDFDYPEEKMESKEWFGGGPYHVWQNRLRGTELARWSTPYNNHIPGQDWTFPEFKGWFSGWSWMSFTTTEGRFAFLNGGGAPYVGVYTPHDGAFDPVLVIPRTGLGVYQVIPAMGSKTARPDETGPEGEPKVVDGEVRGTLVIRVLENP
ncbi:beta-galactosidase [mine drainage metagenome]|uniref:beta-galactosidase n=1 Tax=mine drainage metagenome TaxID=410659 RepID=A0A1J5SHV5_9ZZZZ